MFDADALNQIKKRSKKTGSLSIIGADKQHVQFVKLYKVSLFKSNNVFRIIQDVLELNAIFLFHVYQTMYIPASN